MVRFEYVVRLNLASLGDCDVSKFTHADTRPHYIVRRVAELCGTLATLHHSYTIEVGLFVFLMLLLTLSIHILLCVTLRQLIHMLYCVRACAHDTGEVI